MNTILLENSDIQFIDGDRGKNYPKQNDFLLNSDCLFLSAKNVTNSGFLFDELSFISREKDLQLKSGKLQKNDIVITTRGTIGNVALYDENVPFTDIRINSGMLIIRANDRKWDINFLYNYFRSENFQSQVKSLVSGSAVPQLPVRDIKKLSIPYFDKEKQKEISDKIEVLNQKILINTQTAQTLEAIAQTIFKSWFVDFDPIYAKITAKENGENPTLAAMQAISGKNVDELHRLQTEKPTQWQELAELANAFPDEIGEDGVPMGWEQTDLSSICDMKNGYAFKSKDWTDDGIPVIKIGSVKPMLVDVYGNGFVSEEKKISQVDFIVKDGDILVGLTGYVGEVGRMPHNSIAMLNQRVAKFIPKENFYNYLYCAVRQIDFKQFAENNAKGSAQANISTRELSRFPIIKASNDIHKAFENKTGDLLKLILSNSSENQILSKTRDELLPKLLSGELQNE